MVKKRFDGSDKPLFGRWKQVYSNKHHLFVNEIIIPNITVFVYVKYVSRLKKSKNTSLKKLIKKRYYIINYLKEYVI